MTCSAFCACAAWVRGFLVRCETDGQERTPTVDECPHKYVPKDAQEREYDA